MSNKDDGTSLFKSARHLSNGKVGLEMKAYMTILKSIVQEEDQVIAVKGDTGSRDVSWDVAIEGECPDPDRADELRQKVGILNPRLASRRVVPGFISLGPQPMDEDKAVVVSRVSHLFLVLSGG